MRPAVTGIVPRKRVNVPGVSNDDQNTVTPNPQEFGAPFDIGIPKNLPVWPWPGMDGP